MDMSLGGYLQNKIKGRLERIEKAYNDLITSMADLQKAEVDAGFSKIQDEIATTARAIEEDLNEFEEKTKDKAGEIIDRIE